MSYDVDKLASHPHTLRQMQQGGPGELISVHLMPQNLCNQHCSFCSYRLPLNKNSEDFNDAAYIPWSEMQNLLADFNKMGVQGIEVTGGGEPLAYPYSNELWLRLAELGFATALVTNGSLLKDRAPLICASNLKWVRVSIDAATEDVYCNMRLAPKIHFYKAWEAVREFRKYAPPDPEFRLGVGFVLSNENIDEVYDFVSLARANGADNVRLSLTFSDDHEDYFNDHGAVERALLEAERAKADFEDSSFTVHNLMGIRWKETIDHFQDYHICPMAQVLCVVEGEGRVYTCCTFTGSLKGNQGVFWEHPEGFKGLWKEKEPWRRKIYPRNYCQNACLYEKRNKAMIELIEGGGTGEHNHVHKEFI